MSARRLQVSLMPEARFRISISQPRVRIDSTDGLRPQCLHPHKADINDLLMNVRYWGKITTRLKSLCSNFAFNGGEDVKLGCTNALVRHLCTIQLSCLRL